MKKKPVSSSSSSSSSSTDSDSDTASDTKKKRKKKKEKKKKRKQKKEKSSRYVYNKETVLYEVRRSLTRRCEIGSSHSRIAEDVTLCCWAR